MVGESDSATPSLFVYIPTYNRPSALRRQLDALTAQVGDWPGRVRILVSDNASPEFTDADATALAQDYGVEVRRNAGNLQANANIALGFVFARSDEYLWILSDNDTLHAGALKIIAEDGLIGGPDAIAIDTGTCEPRTTVRSWDEGWSIVGEMGLISNVIYKTAVFAPQSAQAFFFHNTGFPHLAVLLATLKARGSLRVRVLPSARVFVPAEPHGEEFGDYSVSLSGMPQLVWLLPPNEARRFCRMWLREQGLGFVRNRDANPEVHFATRAILIKHLGFDARITLRALAALERVRVFVPEGMKRKLRGPM